MNIDSRHIDEEAEVYCGILLYVRVLYNCALSQELI